MPIWPTALRHDWCQTGNRRNDALNNRSQTEPQLTHPAKKKKKKLRENVVFWPWLNWQFEIVVPAPPLKTTKLGEISTFVDRRNPEPSSRGHRRLRNWHKCCRFLRCLQTSALYFTSKPPLGGFAKFRLDNNNNNAGGEEKKTKKVGRII